MHQEFEHELAKILEVPEVSLFCNATIAMAASFNALRLTGEVITTPFSFVATTHSLHWSGIRPAFVDIDPFTLNLDPSKIEAAIRPSTSAILPVHVYGTPCDTDAIARIADLHGLRVVYDAAHAFGVRQQGRSILNQGDASILSFHATKTFNTFEGGAVICRDRKLKQRLDYLRNFGFADEVTVVLPGINGKMNELQAAIGLVQLKHFEEEVKARSNIDRIYRERLAQIRGIRLVDLAPDTTSNYGYFPILVGPDFPLTRDELYQRLREHDIFARRYFYPLISEFPMYADLPTASMKNLPVAYQVSRQVLCLPIYSKLSIDDVERIVEIISTASKTHHRRGSRLHNV
jgi:dTDP-4-amino-4,6-dideoxygalactose transaminase